MAHTMIIGAGITGAALAFECAARGDRVSVISTHAEGGHCSTASFGWLNASFYLSEAHFTLRHAALAAHRALQGRVSGLPTRWPGCLWYEETGAAQEEMASRLTGLGYRVEHRSRAQIARDLPALGPVPDSALFFPEEGVADPASLALALLAASGAQVIRATVEAVTEAQGRASGVQTDQGHLPADRVVLATGIGTPALLAPLGFALPMLQRPGMVIATEPLPPICPLILAAPDQEVRQDAEGRLIAPASAGHQSDEAEALGAFPIMVTATLARLRGLFPGADIRFGRQAMAMRPVPGDGLPVAGPGPIPGLWIAVMHSGATLAPVVAGLLAGEIHGEADSPLLASFRPNRFQ